jgi:UDP-glucose 4-epimerase
MRIVVIGATGNVGTALLRRLHRVPGVELTGVARRLPDATRHPYDDVTWRALDIGADGADRDLAGVLHGADAVVHLAWRMQPNHREAEMARTNLHGLRNVILAAVDAGVPQLAVVTSVGSYGPGPKHREVGETWPTGGVQSSHYGRQKALTERMLDAVETRVPELTVTRIRPGIVMHGDAGTEVARLFLGPLVPTGWIGRVPVPIVPAPASLVAQVVHESDLAEAIWRAVDRRAGGAFNIATDPPLSPELLADVLGGRWVRVPTALLRAVVDVTWRLRLQATDPGWLDLATQVPVMSTARAREVLGWRPTVDAATALGELLDGMAAHRSVEASPALRR